MTMLSVSGVETFYGNIQALRGVDLSVRQGEIVTLIGANGAGKSTLLMTICGNPRGERRADRVRGPGDHPPADLRDRPPGIAQSPEGRRIFPAHDRAREPADGRDDRPPSDHFDEDLAKVFELFPILKERQGQRGGTLSGGEQQMLAIARALMGRPRLLLLDEPSLGLAPMIVKQIFEVIRQINRGAGHDRLPGGAERLPRAAPGPPRLCHGQRARSHEGGGDELLANEEVRKAYLEGGLGTDGRAAGHLLGVYLGSSA